MLIKTHKPPNQILPGRLKHSSEQNISVSLLGAAMFAAAEPCLDKNTHSVHLRIHMQPSLLSTEQTLACRVDGVAGRLSLLLA